MAWYDHCRLICCRAVLCPRGIYIFVSDPIGRKGAQYFDCLSDVTYFALRTFETITNDPQAFLRVLEDQPDLAGFEAIGSGD